ncbi:cytochrome c/FTR1 family iron permease [Fontimonas thermophila]|nr:cytochrome c/FTR1 family iron permease [Fontimonas thermophila]
MVVWLSAGAAHASASADSVATIWRLLDYIAVDYRGAVDEQGAVIDAGEYAEMQEFARTVAERLAALPAIEAAPQLQAQAAALVAAIDARHKPQHIAQAARSLADDLIVAYPIVLAPAAPPDLARGQALYAEHCAACHGARGAGDGPLAAGMDPPPIAFTDAERASERSLLALYQVTTQGLDGTAMPSFAHLSAEDRWALAFYVGGLAFSPEQAQRGAALWREGIGRSLLPDLKTLSATTPAALATALGPEPATALMAYLRHSPDAVIAGSSQWLAIARERLDRMRKAYASGDRRAAADAALSAYLDGFEPIEPLLATRDSALRTRVEAAMTELRARIARGAAPSEVEAQAQTVAGLFDETERVLGANAADGAQAFSTFLGALTILLREGLEALLIVVAIVAFLRKAERSEVLPYVHIGWIGALAAGVATWGVATYLVSISGAGRELTEGIAALFAAAVLLFVGIWMHGKSQAGAWQRYVRQKLSQALSKRSAWFLALLAFVVVYREVFETILFYAAMWTQGGHRAIVAGATTAALLLVAIAWAMLRWSRRLPIAQFFAISAALVAVLTVVLAGKGIAALQEAGVIGVRTLDAPRIDWLGIHPTWQGIGVQLAVVLVLIGGFAWNRHTARIAAQRTA